MDSTSLPVPEHFWFCCVATPSFELPPGDLAWALHLLDSLFLPRPPSHPRVHLADIDTSIPRSWSGVAWPTHSTRFAVGAADRRVLDPPTRRPFYCRSDLECAPRICHRALDDIGVLTIGTVRPPFSLMPCTQAQCQWAIASSHAHRIRPAWWTSVR
ncbi:hypothetical protein DAEQUDRAFT_554927 [Daedalea quercina L-15889]|uniref:Uncharacterized protein n=1 Tax=Daedalea quercina L-15889 TaxID=1314783 RepID=A0A165T585_9APHY|nr:hypothetical protein DAEQUDRAFT_554927 [Daedalea quercina L-15889]